MLSANNYNYIFSKRELSGRRGATRLYSGSYAFESECVIWFGSFPVLAAAAYLGISCKLKNSLGYRAPGKSLDALSDGEG